MKKALILLLLTGLSIMASEKPNIILILADDMGAMDVGFMGNPFNETPNLDQLAADGVVFSDAYAAGPNCAPARASLMSGTYSPRHKIYTPGGKSKGDINKMKLKVPSRGGNSSFDTFKSIDATLKPEFTSLAELLKQAGYTTASHGKWHLGPDKQGFDEITSDGRGGTHTKTFYGNKDVHEWITNAGLKFIDKNKDKPFFLYLAHYDVHLPIRARKNVVDKYKSKKEKGDFDQWNPTYAAMMQAVDTSVGQIRRKLKDLKIDDNTIIIFTSDNGGVPEYTHNKPFKGGKGSLFEGGIRVPFCMTWPKKIKAASNVSTPISGVDFMPTFADIIDVALPQNQPVDGESIMPFIQNEQTDRGSIFWHYPLYLAGGSGNKVIPVHGTNLMYFRGVPASAMRKGDWKLIHYFEDDSVKLFNVRQDKSETENLAQKLPEKTSELLAELRAWQKKTAAPIPTELNQDFGKEKKKKGKKKGPKRK